MGVLGRDRDWQWVSKLILYWGKWNAKRLKTTTLAKHIVTLFLHPSEYLEVEHIVRASHISIKRTTGTLLLDACDGKSTSLV